MPEDANPLVLIVDRHLNTLNSLDSLLSREGYRVATCTSAAEALKAVAGQKIDLVIAGMPVAEQGEATLVSRIKALSPETRVLVFMETDDTSRATDTLTAGADGLLRKSYSESQVILRVERLLHAVQA